MFRTRLVKKPKRTRLLLPTPASHAHAVRRPSRVGDVVGTVTELLAERTRASTAIEALDQGVPKAVAEPANKPPGRVPARAKRWHTRRRAGVRMMDKCR